MARSDQQRKKEKRFKQSNRRRLESARAEAAEVERLRDKARQQGLELMSFEITHDAVPDPLMEALPEHQRVEIDDLAQDVLRKPERYRERLEALVAKHPHIPTLWNWLMLSVSKSGDPNRADELAQEIYRRFPNYLFGVAQWVMTLLREERIEEATRVLDGRLGLAKWWPERRQYHATEFVAFNAMLGCYFLAINNRTAAGTQLNMIRDVLPEHPGVQYLENQIVLAALKIFRDEIREGGNRPQVDLPPSRPPRVLQEAGIARTQ